MQVVKLTDRRDTRKRHFEKRHARSAVDLFRRQSIRGRVHLLAPRPERISCVLRAPLRPPANHTLKRMRVSINEPRQKRASSQPLRTFNFTGVSYSTNSSSLVGRYGYTSEEFPLEINQIWEPGRLLVLLQISRSFGQTYVDNTSSVSSMR